MTSTPYTREHFRIEYPISIRPKLRIHGEVFEVIDLSEKGIRFDTSKSKRKFLEGTRLTGIITFRDDESFETRGLVIRQENNCVVLSLEMEIPLKKIMDEQRYLLVHFPDHIKLPE